MKSIANAVTTTITRMKNASFTIFDPATTLSAPTRPGNVVHQEFTGRVLGCPVLLEHQVVGHIIDVRLIPGPPITDQPMPNLRIYGFVISPYATSSTLGSERSTVRTPRSIAAIQRWRHRGSDLVRWSDIETIRTHQITLRPGRRRYSPQLIRSASGPGFDDREN
ncbi:hypothetical protein [Microlunatus ginsengisoli]|uniref:hypothetical protein n=1 Tax=Microlunatus ginsengisoli TaxID=363863 RepID=UPI0031E0A703